METKNKNNNEIKRSDFDSGWKEMVEIYFKDGMELLYSELDEIIDYKRGYKFIDKELEEITGKKKSKRKVVDKLAEIRLKNGEGHIVYLHSEFQQGKEKEFTKRIYTYNSLIFNKYKKNTISLVILGDNDKKWRPEEYKVEYPGFKLYFKYKLVKLIDFKEREEELRKSKNPFSKVILSHLKRIEAGNDVVKQFKIKKELVKELYDIGLKKEDIRNLVKFIDCIFQLPDELEEEYIEEIRKYEEVKKMPLVMTAEVLGYKKGIEEGIEKGIEKGREEGREEGIEKQKIETIKRMHKKGYKIEDIAEIVDVSVNKIYKIIKNGKKVKK